jgi:hypothetical protein
MNAKWYLVLGGWLLAAEPYSPIEGLSQTNPE